MKIETQDGVTYARAESSDVFSTFGGEFWDGCSKFADYGLDLGEISISDINPAQYKSLAIEMINHLLINGYSFAIKDNRDGNGEYLVETTIYLN